MEGPPPRPVHLMLGAQTAHLLAALWDEPLLFADAHRIRRRAVAWGKAPDAELLPAPGIVVGADDLANRLAALSPPSDAFTEAAAACWTIDAGAGAIGPHAPDPMRAFGRRQARVARVSLKPAALDDQCIMEGTANGWAFLAPFAPGHASLQFVSALSPEDTPVSQQVIAGSRLIREAVADAGGWSAPMPCMPRLGNTLAAPGRLAVGEAALGFDPISGDGVGHALRGTVLAAKTLGEITDGTDPSECLDRYAATLRRALLQHVDICLSLYGDAPDACDWSGELETMRSGAANLRQSAAATQRDFDRTI